MREVPGEECEGGAGRSGSVGVSPAVASNLRLRHGGQNARPTQAAAAAAALHLWPEWLRSTYSGLAAVHGDGRKLTMNDCERVGTFEKRAIPHAD